MSAENLPRFESSDSSEVSDTEEDGKSKKAKKDSKQADNPEPSKHEPPATEKPLDLKSLLIREKENALDALFKRNQDNNLLSSLSKSTEKPSSAEATNDTAQAKSDLEKDNEEDTETTGNDASVASELVTDDGELTPDGEKAILLELVAEEEVRLSGGPDTAGLAETEHKADAEDTPKGAPEAADSDAIRYVQEVRHQLDEGDPAQNADEVIDAALEAVGVEAAVGTRLKETDDAENHDQKVAGAVPHAEQAATVPLKPEAAKDNDTVFTAQQQAPMVHGQRYNAGGGNTYPIYNAQIYNALPNFSPNQVPMVTVEESQREVEDAAATSLVAGLVAGFVVGNWRGKRVVKRELLPVQKKLEQQVEHLHQRLLQGEERVKELFQQKNSLEQTVTARAAESIAPIAAAAITREQIKNEMPGHNIEPTPARQPEARVEPAAPRTESYATATPAGRQPQKAESVPAAAAGELPRDSVPEPAPVARQETFSIPLQTKDSSATPTTAESMYKRPTAAANEYIPSLNPERSADEQHQKVDIMPAVFVGEQQRDIRPEPVPTMWQEPLNIPSLYGEAPRSNAAPLPSKQPENQSPALPRLESSQNSANSVEQMSQREVVEVASTISLGNVTAAEAYLDKHLISEEGLRHVVVEHLRGGDVRKVYRDEIKLKHVAAEIRHELDPNLHGRPLGVDDAWQGPQPQSTVNVQSSSPGASSAGNTDPRAPSPVSFRQGSSSAVPPTLIVANIAALAVLAILLVVFVIVWITR